MKPKIYSLSFDPHVSNAENLHAIVTAMPHTIEWWHYLGSTYLITSHASALELQNYVNQKWVGRFLVSEIQPKNTGGWLPKEAWDWINSRL